MRITPEGRFDAAKAFAPFVGLVLMPSEMSVIVADEHLQELVEWLYRQPAAASILRDNADIRQMVQEVIREQ